MEDEGTTLVGRYIMSRNFTKPRHSFGKFQLGNGDSQYAGQHVRTIARRLNVNRLVDDTEKVVFEMRVPLPFPVDARFTDKEGRAGNKKIKYSRTGEVHVHLELIEMGHDRVTRNDFDLRSTRGPPTNISVYSNSVENVDMDDVTMGFSTFSASGPLVRSRSVRVPRSVRGGGGTAAMSTYTYETVTDQRSRSARSPRVVARSAPAFVSPIIVNPVTENNGDGANVAMPPPRSPVVFHECLEPRGVVRHRDEEEEASLVTPSKRIYAEAGRSLEDTLLWSR